MKSVTLLGMGLILGGCAGFMPGSGSEPDVSRRVEFVTLIEANGCRLEKVENEDVLVPAGFTDEEAGALGALLLAENQAEIADDGDLILLTENCL